MTCKCRFVTPRALKKALLDYATKTDMANLVDQTALDAAVANLVDQAALDTAVANLVDQTALNAAVANLVDQTALNAAVANLVDQTALDAAIDDIYHRVITVYNNQVTDLALLNGWQEHFANSCRVVQHNGVVYVQGVMQSGNDGVKVCNLPVGPQERTYFSCPSNISANARLYVNSGGEVFVYGSSASGWYSLSNIIFPIAEEFFAPG